MERLQKLLSQAGVASRRASERLMLEGRVTVNGTTVCELGTKADLDRDDIRVDGRRVKVVEHHRYILLNKPRGFVSTRSDPEARPTVIDLLAGVKEYVYPVGRLDFDSEGLLLLTNDGDLAAKLTHPRYGIPRVYEAQVLGVPDERDLNRLARGVLLAGERTAPITVKRLAGPTRLGDRRAPRRHDTATLILTLSEGRNRQVRKMCEAIGHPVTALRRLAIGPIRDPSLRPGHWRELTSREIKMLRAATEGGARTSRP
jgi:pseudouridine synthase